ncbi:MAG: response regulator [Lachnospiraceae bacterium]|nr:response regulator [Lachnospiraceae bacterium]
MNKLFLIGKFNEEFEKINNFLSSYFSVQVCVDNLMLIKGMLKLNRPDIIVVNMVGLEDDKAEILVELQASYADIPTICIKENDVQKAFAVVLQGETFHVVEGSQNYDTLLEKIYEQLHIDYDVDSNVFHKDKGDRKCILLIDDSAIQLRALNEMLKGKYDVLMATSGVKALTLIGKRLPDIIFLDYDMPVCDGRMTLQMIREIEEAQDIPVVFLTGLSDMEHIRSVLELHPAGYLLKPASRKIIYEVLDKYLYCSEDLEG